MAACTVSGSLKQCGLDSVSL
jgi:hypothetical protein